MSVSQAPTIANPLSAFKLDIHISSTTLDVRVNEYLVAAGWNGRSVVKANIYIDDGVIVGCTRGYGGNRSTQYFTEGASSYRRWSDCAIFVDELPDHSIVTLDIGTGAYVSGFGGTGVLRDGPSGYTGGHAIGLKYPITINNRGTIQSGGGGGGASVYWGGSGGGGYQGGLGHEERNYGGDGGLTYGGSAGGGGAGGAPGNNGAAGDRGARGYAGMSVINPGLITWINQGTIRGPQTTWTAASMGSNW